MPMFQLSYLQYANGVKSYVASDESVEKFNKELKTGNNASNLQIACNPKSLNEDISKKYFNMLDSLSLKIQHSKDLKNDKHLLLQRAVAYSVIQNFYDAENDLSAYIQTDSTSVLAYWQRAVCLFMMQDYDKAQGNTAGLKDLRALTDLDKAISLSPANAYLYYNRGNIYAAQNDYAKAILDYTKAIELDPRLAEAYYNRGLAYIYTKKADLGIKDLSKAGEYGLVNAYSAIKKYRQKDSKQK